MKVRCAAPATWIAVLLLVTVGCGRFSPDRASFSTPPPPSGGGGIGSSSQVDIDHPLFGGLTAVIANDESLHLRWAAATDDLDATNDLRYRIYLATESGSQDFSSPAFETPAGATSATVPNLVNGTRWFVVVRAVDLDGHEDPNRIEWSGTPNPVRFVSGAATGPADGLTPATAFSTLGQAVGATIGLSGVNLWVAAGLYSENVFLFPGMAVYGGFGSALELDGRDPGVHVTEFVSSFDVDLVDLQPGNLPIVFDGCVVTGQSINRSGIRVEDVPFSIANCEIRDFPIHGVEILSDVAEGDPIRGVLRGCAILRSGAEGVLIDALGEIVIDDCQIADNGTEGIEAKFIYAEAGETTRVEITRNRIARNGDEGIDLDYAELSEVDPTASAGGRIRTVIRANDIRDNRLAGIQLDIDFEPLDDIEFEARIEDNQISGNLGEGIRLDGDSPSSFRLARNVISANGNTGLFISGAPEGPWVRVLHCRILGNDGAGLWVEDHAGVEVRHCTIALQSARSIRAAHASVDLAQSIVFGNGGAVAQTTTTRHCAILGEPFPTHNGPDVFSADPLLENYPTRAAHTTSTGPTDAAPVATPSAFFPGQTIELGDDGVPRTVLEVLSDRIVFAPPRSRDTQIGEAVFGFGGTSVAEKDGLLDGSPAIDAGDPEERDRDGTIADLGPVGGDTPGNVGIETGLGLEPLSAEPDYWSPLPSLLATQADTSIRFRRDVDPGLVATLRVEVDGALVAPVIVPSAADVLQFSYVLPAPGSQVEVEVGPFLAGTEDPERESARLRTTYVVAESVTDGDQTGNPNQTVATAQLVSLPTVVTGAIALATDRDHYRIQLTAGDRLSAEVIARRRETSLLSRLSILDPNGTTLVSSISAPPLDLDPVIDAFTAPATGAYTVRVESSDGTGSAAHTYELHLRQP